MLRFILARLFSAIVVVIGVSTLVFMLIHLVPGDPVEVMLGESAHPADRAALRHALGLDQPLPVQLYHYFYGLLRFDLGNSLHTQRPIAELMLERVPATLELALAALLVAIAIALPLGILSAIRKDTAWDHSARLVSLIGTSILHFWLGPLLILVFSLWLGWLPVSGRGELTSLVLPALTLGTALAAILSRMLRATLLETLNEDYIRTARAKGLSETAVILQHTLRNALLPVVTVLGLQLGALLGGAIITEMVFSWPGIGQLTIEAIHRRDYPVVQACILLVSVTYVAINTLTDLAYAGLDPRVRLRERG